MKKILLITSIILMLMSVISCGDVPDTFKVIYHDTGNASGFPPTDNNKYKSGDLATVLGKNTLEKTGYEFAGWNTNADNTGTIYNPGDKIEIKKINIFLYTVWEVK
jgi:hypothetical protein